MLQYQWQGFPSHGRGRRFNPCSAHQFSSEIGSCRQFVAERNQNSTTAIHGKSVE